MLSALAQDHPTMSCIPLYSKYNWIVVLITDLDQKGKVGLARALMID